MAVMMAYARVDEKVVALVVVLAALMVSQTDTWWVGKTADKLAALTASALVELWVVLKVL